MKTFLLSFALSGALVSVFVSPARWVVWLDLSSLILWLLLSLAERSAGRR